MLTTPHGGPIYPNNLLRNLAGINWKGNAPGDGANVPLEEVLPRFFDVHDLRHTHATRLLMDG